MASLALQVIIIFCALDGAREPASARKISYREFLKKFFKELLISYGFSETTSRERIGSWSIILSFLLCDWVTFYLGHKYGLQLFN